MQLGSNHKIDGRVGLSRFGIYSSMHRDSLSDRTFGQYVSIAILMVVTGLESLPLRTFEIYTNRIPLVMRQSRISPNDPINFTSHEAAHPHHLVTNNAAINLSLSHGISPRSSRRFMRLTLMVQKETI